MQESAFPHPKRRHSSHNLSLRAWAWEVYGPFSHRTKQQSVLGGFNADGQEWAVVGFQGIIAYASKKAPCLSSLTRAGLGRGYKEDHTRKQKRIKSFCPARPPSVEYRHPKWLNPKAPVQGLTPKPEIHQDRNGFCVETEACRASSTPAR